MTRPRFYLLAAAVSLVLASGMSARAVETATARGPQAQAWPRVALEAPPSTAAQAAGAAQSGGEYAGEATCVGCHDDRAYKSTVHGVAFHERTPAATRGCESCHGPGKAHADSGDPELMRSFAELSPAETSATCLTCHNRASHALWDGSQHDQRNISCVTCHSVHAPKGAAQIKAPTQTALCSSCHRNVTNRQHRFNHMPVREGQLACSS